jgi:hypothetical protein
VILLKPLFYFIIIGLVVSIGIIFIAYYNPEKSQTQSQNEQQNSDNVIQNKITNNFFSKGVCNMCGTNNTLVIQISNTPFQNSSLPISVTYTNYLTEPKNSMIYAYVKSSWNSIDLSQIRDVFNATHWVYGGSAEPLVCDNFTFNSNRMCVQERDIELASGTDGALTMKFYPMIINPDNNGIYRIKVSSLYDSEIILPQKIIIISDNTQQYTTYDHWNMTLYDISFRVN